MTWWKRGRCKGCNRKLNKREPLCELEINTTEGVIKMEVCKSCGDFWDGTAEVMQQRKPSAHADDDEEEYRDE